ncbi:MAG: glycerol-3-phosphate acyltransferase, partial [Clostridia bacterium]|nr:glycerol-3-phosphate acyltransferase [Clostridia bacterium]
MFSVFERGIVVFPEGMSMSTALFICFFSSFLFPYLLGSVNSAIVVSTALLKADIRRTGSKNAGLTNMYRVYGGKAALLVLLGDSLKMVLSLLFVGFLFGMQYAPYGFSCNSFLYVAGVACILGHIFPVYYGFKGGKGVLCSAVMVLMLSPYVFVAEFLIFLLVLWATKYVSLSSMTAGIMYPLVFNRVWALFGGHPDGLMS